MTVPSSDCPVDQMGADSGTGILLEVVQPKGHCAIQISEIEMYLNPEHLPAGDSMGDAAQYNSLRNNLHLGETVLP